MYLRRIEIDNFRAFPEGFAFDLTPGPGVTLLVGQNGLGKSTFLEAIEWCLTGTVRRLAELQEGRQRNVDVLCRRGATGAYAVRLFFGTDQEPTFERSVAAGTSVQPAVGTPVQDIVAALKNPAWQEPIADLAAYLKLTHLLSQSGGQRFATRGADERWNAVAAPAGSERLNSAREKLGGRGLTTALNDRVATAAAAVAAATAAIAAWEALVKRLASLGNLAASGGAKSPSEIRATLLTLASRLIDVTGKGLKSDPEAELPVEQRLRELAETIASAQQSASDARRRAASVEDLPLKWQAAVDDIARARGRLALAVARREAAGVTERLSAAAWAAALEGEATARQRAAAASEKLVTLRARERAIAELTTLRNEVTTGEAALALAVAACANARESLAAMTRRLEARRLADEEWSAAAASVASIERAVASSAHLRNLTSEHAALDERGNRLKVDLADLSSRLEAAKNDARVSLEAAKSAEVAAAAFRTRVDAIQRSVSVIAAHVEEGDELCPACATRFARGELKRLVQASASAVDAELASAEETARRARIKADGAAEGVESLERDRRALLNTAETIDRQAAAIEEQRSAILLNLGILEVRGTILDARLARQLAEAKASLDIALQAREALPVAKEIERSVVALRSQLQECESEEARRKQQQETYAARARELEAVIALGDDSSSVDETQSTVGDAAAAEAESAKEVARCGQELKRAVESHRVAKADQVDAAQAAIAAERAVVDAKALADSISEQWRQAGFMGEPGNAEVALKIGGLTRQIGELDGLATDHRLAREALVSWDRAEELRRVEAEVNAACGTNDGAQAMHGAQLRGNLVDAERSLSAARAARDYRSQLVERMKREASEYVSTVLRPLNALNDGFLRMFSCFSDYTVSLDARTLNSNTHLDLLLQWSSGGARNRTSFAARQYLSEGQLSALSVSLLLSMSNMYPWSRWRALLLDDPLQHNDVIHASSFIEVIRGLVKDKGYQIVLSTHDLDLADYIRRKSGAADVDCRTCRFLGSSRDGLLSESV